MKQIVEKQLKSMKDKRMNSQKEGQIGDKQEIPKFEKNLIRQTESSPFITNIVPFAPKLGFGFGAQDCKNRNTQLHPPLGARERLISKSSIS